jgi:mannose-6-phosphate isomerase class I
MTERSTLAEQLLKGHAAALEAVAANPLVLAPDNLVPRPWGGTQLYAFKGLKSQPGSSRDPVGESFELAADDQDEEARQFPSQVILSDGSTVSLPRLLEAGGLSLLGAAFVARYGPRFPLLPKLLNIKELLSVQGHPAGNTETYIILAAEPGATLRLGFNRDMDGPAMITRLERGRGQQRQLLAGLPEALHPARLQAVLAPALASGVLDSATLIERLQSFGPPRTGVPRLAGMLERLHETYWWMLDAMNVIPVAPGQVIHNCNPDRLVAAGAQPSAEVHALGNPEGREVLALEVRKPGPTFRAWDNVRFPLRPVDVAAAVDALNLRATSAAEFNVDVVPVAERPGTFVSVDSEYFRIEHLRPDPGIHVTVPAQHVHCLHGVQGAARLLDGQGAPLGEVRAGHSLLIPSAMGHYGLSSDSGPAEVIKVSLPV